MGDSRVEGDETILLELGNLIDPTGLVTIEPLDRHTLTIEDNDEATIALRKSTLRPKASVKRPSSMTCNSVLKTSG